MAQAYRLAESTRNPTRAISAMRRAMNDTISLLKAIYVYDLLDKLVNRGLTLTTVWSLSRSLCRGLKGDKHRVISKKIMNWKLQDASRVLRERKECHTKMWREEGAVLKEYGVSERFAVIWEVEKCERRRDLNNKKDKKVTFLLEKFKAERSERERREEVDEIRQINVRDQVLDERYESRPRCYGKVEVTPDEKEVLSLTPKFSVYDRVDVVDCQVEIEKALTKLRWSRMGDRTVQENFDSGDEGEEEDTGNVSRTDSYSVVVPVAMLQLVSLTVLGLLRLR